MKLYKIIAAVLLGLVANNVALAYGLRGSVIGNGGNSAPPASSASYRLYGTAGQGAIGYGHSPLFVSCAGFWCFGGPRVVAVDPPGGESLPTEFALGPATPNPTRDEARFHLALPKEARVTLSVYDVGGRQVGAPVSRPFAAGRHDLYWKAPGQRAGIYFVRLETDGVLRAKRTVVVVR